MGQLRSLVGELKREVPDLERIETLVVTVEGAAEDLRGRLAAAGLDGRVKASVSGGTIVAEGKIRNEQEATWREVYRWFDERFGRDLVLDSRVAVIDEPDAPPLSIRAVWAGPSPYVIAGNGQKYVEGTLLDSGWVIERIAQQFIELSREGEKLRLML